MGFETLGNQENLIFEKLKSRISGILGEKEKEINNQFKQFGEVSED